MNKCKEFVIVGQNIRRWRKERGYAQETFAHHINLGRAYYGRIERGEQGPGTAVLIKIAKALDVEVGQLFPSLDELKELDQSS